MRAVEVLQVGICLIVATVSAVTDGTSPVSNLGTGPPTGSIDNLQLGSSAPVAPPITAPPLPLDSETGRRHQHTGPPAAVRLPRRRPPGSGGPRPLLKVGVNGHMPAQTPYKSPGRGEISLTAQLAELTALASSHEIYYRNDISCTALAAGGLPAATAMHAFVQQASASNVTVLPILFPDLSTVQNQSDLAALMAAAERSTRTCAAVFAAAAPLQIVEIGNEWDNVCILPGASGNDPSQYNASCVARMVAIYTGMIRGVRDAAPTARVGISSGGWLHYAWYPMLIAAGVDFDIVSWHWYSDMGDLTNTTGPHVDVLAHLVAIGKPIWVTELDRRGGSGAQRQSLRQSPGGEQLQAEWLAHELALLSAAAVDTPLLEAVVVYELYDQMDLDHNSSLTCASPGKDPESCYGLVRVTWDDHPTTGSTFTPDGRKPAWAAVHAWIANISIH